MTSYFEKRKKNKLYSQWVENSGLPPEGVPEELKAESEGDEAPAREKREVRQPGTWSIPIRLTLRHVLYMLLTIAGLLIATVSLATVLIMRSC